MEIVNEFKEFALQGNISETLIGFTVGVAFKDVVSSFVDNLLMPPIGYMIGRVQLQDLYIVLSGGAFESQEQAQSMGVVVLPYGRFLNEAVEFLIIAIVVFVLIRYMNRLRSDKKETESSGQTA